MEKMRIGLIGCGGMADGHQKAQEALKDKMHFTAVCDIVESAALAAKNYLGSEFVCTDYRDMLPYVDAVLVVLPHHLHHDCGVFFASHGKHVLMEKPLCNTEEECLDLIQVCKEHQVVLMTAYTVRYWPEIRELKRLLEEKVYGDVFSLSIWTEQYTVLKTWGKTKYELGGGQFFSHGCHYIDILLYLLGEPVSGVHMGNRLATPWMEGEGTSHCIMKFDGGVLGYHAGTWGAVGTSLGWRIQAQCTKGMLELDRRGTSRIIAYQNTQEHAELCDIPVKEPEVIYENGDSSKMCHYELEHFIDCIRSGKTPNTDGESSLQSLRCIWRMYEAEDSGTMADLRGLGLPKHE